MLIERLKPLISRERAASIFRQSFRELRYGRLRLVLDFHIPYQLVEVTISEPKGASQMVLAVDISTGMLDPIYFDTVPATDGTERIETERYLSPAVDAGDLRCGLHDRTLRMIFNKKGFFKVDRPEIEQKILRSLFIPYWVGIYERKGRVQLQAINAGLGRLEGSKIREVVEVWLSMKEKI